MESPLRQDLLSTLARSGLKKRGGKTVVQLRKMFPIDKSQIKQAVALRKAYRRSTMNPAGRREILQRAREAEERMEATFDAPVFRVGPTMYSRREMMLQVCAEVEEGQWLSKVCDQEGYPTLREVREWERLFPSFKERLEAATKILAERQYVSGFDRVMEATNDDNAKIVQLQSDAYFKSAAKLDQRWGDKQRIEVNDVSKPKDLGDIQARMKALLAANPELLKTIPDMAERMQTLGMTTIETVPTVDTDE